MRTLISKSINVFRNNSYRVGFIYSLSSIWSAVITMSVGVLMIRWISPNNLGIWQSLTIIQLYIGIIEFGVPNGLNRELPYRYGTNEVDYALNLAATAQYFMRRIAILLLTIALIAGYILKLVGYDLQIVIGVTAVGIILALLTYDRYLTVTYRSSESFMSLSKITFVRSLFQIGLLPLIFFYEYYGLVSYSVLVVAVLVLAKHIYRPIKKSSEFNKKLFVELMKTGLPVYILNYIRGVSSTFNKVLLLKYGSVLLVGLFAPVAAIGTLVSIIPSILGNYLFPKMNIMLGKSNDSKILWPMVLKLNIYILPFVIPIILALWFIIPPMMNTYFVEYESATFPMQVFTLNLLAGGTLVSHNVIYAIKDYKIGLIFGLCEFLSRILLPLLVIYLFDLSLLLEVSIGYTLSSLILIFINLFLIKKAIFK